MNKIFTILFLLATIIAFGQKQKNEEFNNQLLNERISNTNQRVGQLENQQNNNRKMLSEDLNKIESNLTTKIDTTKSDLKDLLDRYVYFITTILIIIGIIFSVFGRKLIKNRVEELIVDTAQKHIEKKISDTLNSKITNNLIEKVIKEKSEIEIRNILENLKQKGNHTIATIQQKGDDAIKTMLANPPKINMVFGKKNMTDIEINKQNDTVRADEFFNMAFNSSDPRIQIELYKNVLEIEPNNYAALNNMAVAHNNLNEPSMAIEALNKALSINPNYFQAYANRAQAFNLQDKFEYALKDIENAINLNSKFEYAYAVQGNILTKQGKLEEAENVLNAAIELNENSAEAYYNRAFFYEERKQFEKSEKDYKNAERLGFGNKAMLYNNMAVLYRRLKQFDKAIEFIEKAKSYNPNFPNLDGTLALIYSDKGNDEKFYEHLKIALEKGCQAWNYLPDPGFDRHRDSKRLNMLIEPYKKRYFA